MSISVNLYSTKKNEIKNFLGSYYNKNFPISDDLKWEIKYDNPTQVADIIGVFIDNNDKYQINMWIQLDSNFYLNVNDNNVNKIIKYIFERYPY
ncbi:MAG: hypothetical protein IJN50_07835 [Clostridia bacterium]|nr:hypothetical protein [Clostridia bacterium]